MTRQFLILLAGISTAVLLAAGDSTESNTPTAGTGTDSALAASPPPTDAMTPRRTGPPQSGIGPESEATAKTLALHGTIAMTVGTVHFSATLADTDTARAFADRLPLTLDMTDVNNNEKAFDLTQALPSDARNPGTIHNGELMLYGSKTIVLFYESFDTSYTYTRIGRVDAPDGLPQVLGAGDVTVTFAHQ